MTESNLQKEQEILYKLFNNSINSNRIANSYILYGDLNSPLKDTAMYLAKSLSCNESTFACNSCPSCKRFDQGKAPDSFFIDGSNQMIKKQNIKDLVEHFEYSTFEKDHIPTYVIHLVDNITEEAANALLKFLEEPKQELVAFLTTHNLDAVLKTILSRSIKVKVNPLNHLDYYNQLLSLEYPKRKGEKISVFLAYILSKISSSIDEANSIIEDENNVFAIEVIEEFLELLENNKKEAIYLLLSLTSKIKDNKCYNYLFITLSTILSDILSNNISEDCGISETLKNIPISKNKLISIKNILEEVVKFKRYNLSNTTTIAKIIKIIEE